MADQKIGSHTSCYIFNTFVVSCFRDVMSAGQTVFADTCTQCVVEIKRTKQYFLICVRASFFRPLLSQAVLHNVVYRSKTKNLNLFYWPFVVCIALNCDGPGCSTGDCIGT